MAIGARSQSARTYLEKSVEEFEAANLDDLLMHALKALRDTLPADSPTGLTLQNCSAAVLGIDVPFTILDETDRLKALLDHLPPPAGPRATESTPEAQPTEPAPAQTEGNQMDL